MLNGELQLSELSFIQMSADGILMILGAQEMDAGEYECRATNEAGTSSAVVILDVGGIGVLIQF
jgi:hypothetical protein